MKRIALVLALLAVVGCAGRMYFQIGPPPNRVEVISPQPGEMYVWTEGFWGWDHQVYVWTPGRWVQAPRQGAVWVPGEWRSSRRGFYWMPGRWEYYRRKEGR